MSEDLLKFILQRVINNAKDASKDFSENKSEFNDGRCLAYYEVLDTIKNELEVHEFDISEFGFPVKIENIM